jgi:hypothetical protein
LLVFVACFQRCFFRRKILIVLPTGTAFSSAASDFIDRGPGAPFRFFDAEAAVFVTVLNVFRHGFLLGRVTGFIAAWHKIPFV